MVMDSGPTLAELGPVLELRFEDGSRQRLRLAEVAQSAVALRTILPLVVTVHDPSELVERLLTVPYEPAELVAAPEPAPLSSNRSMIPTPGNRRPGIAILARWMSRLCEWRRRND